jgi:acetolactate synthase-1/2/3 large subunit
VGLRAKTMDEVEPVLREAFSIRKPVLMDFWVNPEEGVYPMVPAGKNISEMLLV